MNAPDGLSDEALDLARRVAALAARSGRTVATAESLTGGKLSCHLSAAPDSSTWFRGGVVAYAEQVKYEVLGVPVGPVVSERAARSMALGVSELLQADVAVAVTGVGGPDDEEGEPPGTVWMGVAAGGDVHTELHRFDGDPTRVLDKTVTGALRLLLQTMDGAGAR